MVRRSPGSLLPLEVDVLAAGVALAQAGEPQFHGYAVASYLADSTTAKRLTSHGTLYKALGRLADAGLLEAEWEDPMIAEGQGRPRRRLYRISGAGASALAQARRAAGPEADSTRGAAARRPVPGTT